MDAASASPCVPTRRASPRARSSSAIASAASAQGVCSAARKRASRPWSSLNGSRSGSGSGSGANRSRWGPNRIMPHDSRARVGCGVSPRVALKAHEPTRLVTLPRRNCPEPCHRVWHRGRSATAGALTGALSAIGERLKPRVFAVSNLKKRVRVCLTWACLAEPVSLRWTIGRKPARRNGVWWRSMTSARASYLMATPRRGGLRVPTALGVWLSWLARLE